VDNIET
jgi:sialidase-1